MRWPTIIAFLFGVALPSGRLPAAENWPQWRGPLGTGVAAAGDYPVTFSDTEGVAWKVKLPGKGSSTPAVWGDRIFVSCAIGESPEAIGFGRGRMKESTAKDGLVCYDMQGNELWRRELGTERPGKHPNGSGSNPSPVTDGKHVVVFYKSGTLACFDVVGKELWRTNLHERFGKDTLWWDLGTSPVLANGRAVVAIQQSPWGQGARYGRSSGDDAGEPSQSYLVALDLVPKRLLPYFICEHTAASMTKFTHDKTHAHKVSQDTHTHAQSTTNKVPLRTPAQQAQK
jgi:hypothetical protein